MIPLLPALSAADEDAVLGRGGVRRNAEKSNGDAIKSESLGVWRYRRVCMYICYTNLVLCTDFSVVFALFFAA